MEKCKAVQTRDWGWLVVLAALSFAAYPLLQDGLPPVADAAIHLFRTAEWVRVWRDGILYPRWAPNLAFGYGFPLFIFAPPLPYALAGLFHLAGLSLASAIKVLPLLSFVLMGLGTYFFVRDVFGPRAAILSGTAFAYAPFVLREAYLYGGNYPQMLAIASFPWVLWALRRVTLRGSPTDIAWAAIACTALILSHIFHAVVFMPIAGAYILGLLAIEQKRSTIRHIAVMGILALALSAAFWLPALAERRWTHASEGFYMMRSHFGSRFLSFEELLAGPQALDARAANPYLPFALGWGILFLAALGVFSLLTTRSDRHAHFHVAFFGGVFLLSVGLMLPLAAPAWERLPFLAIGEFPWRLMGIAASSLSILLSPLGRRLPWPIMTGAILLIIGSSLVYTYPFRPFWPYGTPTLSESAQYESTTQTIGTTTLGEYLPVWVKEAPTSSPLLANYFSDRPIDKLDRSTLPQGASAQLVLHDSVRDQWQISCPVTCTIRVHTFYYPGWTATVDGQAVEVRADGPQGLLALGIPAGEHTVEVRFGDTWLRLVGKIISAIALIATAVALTSRWLLHRSPLQKATALDIALPYRPALLICACLLSTFVLRVLIIDPYTGWFRQSSPVGMVANAQHLTSIVFGQKIALLGYDLQSDPTSQGALVRVRLYWQATAPIDKDYSTFVHLDALPDLITRAQSDHVHPGDARAQIDIPTHTWSTDKYVRDEHLIAIPADLPPVAYALRVGLYDREGQRLLVLDDHNRPAGDAAFLQPLHVLPRAPVVPKDLPDASYTRFGAHIELIGARTEPPANGRLRLYLYWRATSTPEADYTVFVHLLDENGQQIAEADAPPVGGEYPTSWWWPGQIIDDLHDIPVNRLPPGNYRLAVGLYDPTSGQRLPATDRAGRALPDSQLVLASRASIK